MNNKWLYVSSWQNLKKNVNIPFIYVLYVINEITYYHTINQDMSTYEEEKNKKKF